MKTILFTIFLFNASLYACETFKGLSFCVSDKAVAENADGTIIGVSKTKVSIDFTGGSTKKKGIGTFEFKDVTLGKGCFLEFCVNEKGVGGNLEGEIVGVSADKISLNHKKADDKYSTIKTYAVNEVLVRKGCVEAYCANKSAVYKTFDGMIVGVNGKTKKVAISFVGGTSKYTGVGTYDIRTVAIGVGCFNGFCINDRAVGGPVDGSIVGINPYRNQVAILGKVSGKPQISMNEMRDVTMRSLSESVHASDSKRTINTLSGFNHSFGE